MYAVGLYSSQPTKGATGDALWSKLGSSFWNLMLQFHRSVDSGAVAGALKDALSPRLDAAVVTEFHEALTKALSDGVPAGSKLHFTCDDSRALHIAVGSTASVATLSAPKLCDALFDVYFGKSPISPAAKASVELGAGKDEV